MTKAKLLELLDKVSDEAKIVLVMQDGTCCDVAIAFAARIVPEQNEFIMHPTKGRV